MSAMTMKTATSINRLLPRLHILATATAALLLAAGAQAAAPGIQGTAFTLTAKPDYISQPDGQSVYSWGYACSASNGAARPSTIAAPLSVCSGSMQIPGPTLIVTQGTFTVTLNNGLPAAAGNTSILFPGLTVVSAVGGTGGPLTQEATPASPVTYTLRADSPGTRAYYSGTQGDLQVEMGLYGAIIVLPTAAPAACGTLASGGLPANAPGANRAARAAWGEADYRLASAAYNQAEACYDREYLFQFSEMDPSIHTAVLAQVTVQDGCTPLAAGCILTVPTEPYHPAYFMINGRSMPDDMDPNYALEYPHQPYNGNPHMHPGEQTLIRVIGQGRWQHPFHEHGNHVRILGRDGNLILASTATTEQNLAGPLFFTTTTTPGQAFDGIFYWTAKGLNWDAYGHKPGSTDPNATLSCVPDANGYNTLDASYLRINYFEFCQDHNKPLQVTPFGDVPGGGPATLPDPNLFTNGPWFGGSPYLGPDATTRATFGGCTGSNTTTNSSTTGTTPPSGTIANNPSSEAGFAFMWHSHNEREITTNNVFPGGMLMMMLVDSREYLIDESN